MKAMHIRVKAGSPNNARSQRKPRYDNPNAFSFPQTTTNQGLTQWPTEKQILNVSKKLAKITQMGIRAETHGDYFHSGDMAYQMHEIILATARLFAIGQRLRRKSNAD